MGPVLMGLNRAGLESTPPPRNNPRVPGFRATGGLKGVRIGRPAPRQEPTALAPEPRG